MVRCDSLLFSVRTGLLRQLVSIFFFFFVLMSYVEFFPMRSVLYNINNHETKQRKFRLFNANFFIVVRYITFFFFFRIN